MASIDVDVAGVTSWRESLTESCARHGLQFEVLEEEGPGGGNPLVNVSGPRDQLIHWLGLNGYDDGTELERIRN